MTLQITTAISLLSLCFLALAQERKQQDIVHLPTDEIHADPSVLEGQRRVSTGQPDRETLEHAAAAGIRTVIDFRTAGEDRGIDEQAEAEARGMSYVSFPVAGSSDMTFEKAAELDQLLADIDGPVLLHCGSGNRVGALFALRASMNGASDAEALEIGEQAGLTRSRAVIEEKLEEN